ncbi:MAG: glycosyltransferase [Bacteriovoracaceae bacterium]|nr:glycosyltransferase [Bacteriovoracaceae bacterium]
MKILFVSDDFLPAVTGVGIHTQQLAKELVRQGHQVTVLTSAGLNFTMTSKTEYWFQVKIFRTRTIVVAAFPQALPLPFEISLFLKKEKPDLIHYHYLSILAAMTSRIAKKEKIPELMTYHFSPDVLTEPWFMRPFRNFVRYLALNFSNKMSTIISPSIGIKKYLEKNGHTSPVLHITNPIPFDLSHVDSSAKIKSPNFTVLYAGRLAIEKNVTFLLMGFKELLNSSPDAILWLAGAGPLEHQLKILCEELGIKNNVKFLGHLNHQELIHYYQNCDVFVLPSLLETLSLVAIEAMSLAKPLIVTDKIISAMELVEHEVNGYIVNSESTSELASRLSELATNPQLLKKMSEASLNHSKNFDLKIVMKKMLDTYQQVINQHD